jgi:hypothetical protein
MTVLTLLGWLAVNTFAKIAARKKASEDSNGMAAEAIARSHGLPV